MSVIDQNQAALIEALGQTPEGRVQLTEMVTAPLQFETSRGRLPERIFRSMFLPWFMGNAQETPERPYTQEWIRVAGNHTSEVEVFSETNGQTLFIVPALFDSAHLNLKFGEPIRDFILMNRDLRNGNPAIAENHLRTGLNAIQNNVRYCYNPTESQERWAKILAYYDLTPAGQTAPTTTTGINVDDYDYF